MYLHIIRMTLYPKPSEKMNSPFFSMNIQPFSGPIIHSKKRGALVILEKSLNILKMVL